MFDQINHMRTNKIDFCRKYRKTCVINLSLTYNFTVQLTENSQIFQCFFVLHGKEQIRSKRKVKAFTDLEDAEFELG